MIYLDFMQIVHYKYIVLHDAQKVAMDSHNTYTYILVRKDMDANQHGGLSNINIENKLTIKELQVYFYSTFQ